MTGGLDVVQMKITRGLPGCGKSTRALAWVAEDPTRRARVNRDARRAEMHGRWLAEPWQETMVTTATTATIVALTAIGVSVVVDDTNLGPEHLDALVARAERCGAVAEVWDMTDVPLQVCIDRDKQRTGDAYVSEQVIRRMYARWLDGATARQVADRQGWIGSRTVPVGGGPTDEG